MLESGNLSFPDGKYFVDFEPTRNGSSLDITHHVEGVPLISRLVEERKAQYACIVSSPLSSYRKIHCSFDTQHTVEWNSDEIGEPPLFTPVVLCIQPDEILLDASRDGVHELWHGQKVALESGSRIVVGNVVQLESSIIHLLSLHADNSLSEGQFVIEPQTEPFRFHVNLHPDLHRFLRNRKNELGNNVMVHIVTACFARLQHDFAEDDGETGWKAHRNLRALSDFLDARELPHWSDDAFRPEKVATALHPLSFPREGMDSEQEESP